MESFELVMVLLAGVILASLAEQLIRPMSLPLVQIATGLLAALLLPRVANVRIDSELFLVLFIAPLLFNEARESSRHELRTNLSAILSLAIGLVGVTVLVVGFVLNMLVPSIPLAAAFACAAALGPTDAAAVSALGSTVHLTKRQKALLLGESLMNDASGVVCFQFAIAAAVTGAFSAAEAGFTFVVMFFGGIAFGIVAGFVAFLGVSLLRRRGLENNIVHVLYEVFTPFLIFLLAEELSVSGILAVVAAGLVMARHTPRLTTTEQAKHNVLSNGFWEIIAYVINGVVFVLLGMQLPQALSPTVTGGYGPLYLIGIIVVLTALVMLARFVWVFVMELGHRDPEMGQRKITQLSASFKETLTEAVKEALVTTIAGPKGALTLSIIFTIPLTLENGEAFPEREFIILVTAGVILCTLILADVLLARLSPSQETGASEETIKCFEVMVLKNTISELESKIAHGSHPEYEPATRVVLGSYRTRLIKAQLEIAQYSDAMATLIRNTLAVQRKRFDELEREMLAHVSAQAAAPYYTLLKNIRGSVGYYDKGTHVGLRPGSLFMKLRMLYAYLNPHKVSDEKIELMYYQTCLFAIELECVALDYLEGVCAAADSSQDVAKAARILLDEHRSIKETLQKRVGYTGEQPGADARRLFESKQCTLSEQYRLSHEYLAMITAAALSIELEKIGELQATEVIGEEVARALRQNVYVLQMNTGIE
ncbi:cation:proton antiporter [Atopobium minutum]|uniref:Na+/H+ antiporter n=1 Tax=Atopobium minutum 10063974 TaxID=997872 RepID=N2BFB9_9ACTN|nr:sodium:proton antiporter [Atopobium minutum]EMZ40457.1 Na+/H+ antiporter [Atopobium minutum 10063974]